MPYAVGEFRSAWASYPVLVRQYHPEWNHGVVLTQVPPAAEVLLTWECDVGHVFVATPAESGAAPSADDGAGSEAAAPPEAAGDDSVSGGEEAPAPPAEPAEAGTPPVEDGADASE